MPKFEQSIPIKVDTSTTLAIAYSTMQRLKWKVLFAGDQSLQADTFSKWNSNGQQVICYVDNGQLNISSEMVNNELVDITGKNKSNVQAFITDFNAIAETIDEATIVNNTAVIEALRHHTINSMQQQQADTEAVNKAMNLTGSNLYVSYTIMAINIIVFILMAINGAGIVDADGFSQIRWGSNFTALTLSGDWWRLVTCVFVHFGIIHLLMNMYCLYTVSVYLEPMLGKVKFTAAYLCTGILSSIVSLWWHKDGVNSAGASGAVFGMYGVFLALLTTRLVPESIRKSLLQSIGIFVVFNLAYGMKGGVDNAAHIGGLLSGLAIGYGYALSIKKEQSQQSINWLVPAIIVFTVAIGFMYLQQHPVSATERTVVVKSLKEAGYSDNNLFNDKLEAFDKVNHEVSDFTSNDSINVRLIKKIDEIGYPKWEQLKESFMLTKKYDISPAAHEKADKLMQYIDLRKSELDILKQMVEENDLETLTPKLNANREKSNQLFAELLKQ